MLGLRPPAIRASPRGPTHPWGALRCRGTENSRDCRRRVRTAGFILTGACSGLVRGPSLQVTDGEMGGPLVPSLSCCSRFQGEACRQETGHTPRHRTLRFFPKEANGIFRSIPVLNSPAMSFGVGPSSSVFCLLVVLVSHCCPLLLCATVVMASWLLPDWLCDHDGCFWVSTGLVKQCPHGLNSNTCPVALGPLGGITGGSVVGVEELREGTL